MAVERRKGNKSKQESNNKSKYTDSRQGHKTASTASAASASTQQPHVGQHDGEQIETHTFKQTQTAANRSGAGLTHLIGRQD